MNSDFSIIAVRSCGGVLLLLLCMLSCVGSLFAQGEKVVVLDHADSLVGTVIDGEEARELIGNVRISQDNVHIQCDHALQFLRTGTVFLNGHVVVTDDSVTLTAPRGIYHRDERTTEAFDTVSLDDGTSRLTARYGKYLIDPRIAFFRSHVTVVDSTSTVTADSLTYYRTDRRSIARGKVSVYNEPDRVTITGGRLDHDALKLYSRMTEQPVLVQFDSTAGGKEDTLVVRSRIMESYRDSTRRLIAIDSVEIVRSDLAALAGLAQFYTRGDSILLRTSPVVWYQQTQVTGDSINVYLKGRKLRLVDVMGNAFAISRSDSLHRDRYDQITGDRMLLSFANQVLHRIDVESHAISVYHLYEDSAGNGLNKSSGDRIVMFFEDGKVRSISIVGGVEGQYFPENMVKDREREYAIPGFLWRGNRPSITSSDFRNGRSIVSQKPKRHEPEP